MKKLYAIILVASVCLSQAFAQLAILDMSGQDITNSTINIPSGDASDIYFKVKNVGSSTIADIKSYLRVGSMPAVNGTDGQFSICANENCGMGAASPKFTLEAGAEMEVHISLTPINATDFVVATYPTGGSPRADVNIHVNTTATPNFVAGNFNVYPSPANESFVIENNFNKNTYVEIYNVLGQVIKTVSAENASQVTINCSNWKNGYYVCRSFKDGKIEKTVKVVIAH